MISANQNPEQLARDQIDQLLLANGWLVQSFKQKNIAAGLGVAIREYPTGNRSADYILFVEILNIGWVKDNKAAAESIIHDFKTWIEAHKTEITALQVFYAQPYQRGELSYAMIRDLAEAIKTSKPTLAPLHVWRAYEQLEKVNGQPKNELIALVSLVRTISGADTTLTSFDKTVDKNFQDWIFKSRQEQPCTPPNRYNGCG